MSISRKGDFSLRLQPGCFVRKGVDGNTGRVIYRGDAEAVEDGAARFKKGTRYTYEGINFWVINTEVITEKGGLATLILELSDDKRGGGGAENSTYETDTYQIELDYTLVEKPISEHPTFKNMFTFTDGEATALYFALKRWESIPDELKFTKRRVNLNAPTEAAMTKEDGPDPTLEGDWEKLTSHAASYATLVLQGIEAFPVQVPVVRKTETFTLASLSNFRSNAGQRETPPAFDDTAEAWLKTADRIVRMEREGSWQRIEEWSGFAELNEIIYPLPGGGGS